MALIPVPTVFSNCALKMDGSSIILKVTVGEGQLGEGLYIVRQSQKKPPSSNGVIESGLPIALGADEDLHGQRLTIRVSVGATLSLNTVITIDLVGGQINNHITIPAKAGAIGDIMAYEAIFRFTKS